MITSGFFHKSKLGLKLIVICVAVFSVALLVTSSVTHFTGGNNAAPQTAQFDWAAYRKEGDTSAGPKIGERIDLSHLKGQNGTTLGATFGNRPIMLSIVGPGCGACREATDQMILVRDSISAKGVGYYVITFNYRREPEKFFKYVDSLGVDSQAFIWLANETQPAESLVGMVVPSHMLIDHNGVVLQRWPGTNHQREVRVRMAKQIIEEALNIVSKTND